MANYALYRERLKIQIKIAILEVSRDRHMKDRKELIVSLSFAEEVAERIAFLLAGD